MAPYYGTYWFYEIARFLSPRERREYFAGHARVTFRSRKQGVRHQVVWRRR